jgi:hypothetical protein
MNRIAWGVAKSIASTSSQGGRYALPWAIS